MRVPSAARSRQAESPTTWPCQGSTGPRRSRPTTASPSRPGTREIPAEHPAGPAHPDHQAPGGLFAWARDLYAHGPRDGICLLGIGHNNTGSSCGITATEIKSGIPAMERAACKKEPINCALIQAGGMSESSTSSSSSTTTQATRAPAH